jgi:hypothetical protein
MPRSTLIVRRHSKRGRVLAALLAVAVVVAGGVLAGWTVGNHNTRLPRSWYVSRLGDDSTGRAWSSAWNELDHIAWPRVRPGDSVVIDGGRVRCPSDPSPASASAQLAGERCGMRYRTELNVRASGRADKPITVRLSRAPGRDGTAVIFGGRATALPYCNQAAYRPSGRARRSAVAVAGSHVVLDGVHRSGLMIHGAQSGVEMAGDTTAFVTLRNLEIFDDGTYDRWQHGYRTDGEGVSLAGHDIAIERTLIHDNGQDAVQDRDTGVPKTGHAPLHDIRIADSWLFERRENPRYPGFGFNSGAQDVAAQDCTHVDGVQIWGGGLHQQRLTFAHDVFGPGLAQGVYLGNADTASVDHVTIADVLFLNPFDHAIIGDAVAADRTTPYGWHISNVTSYMTDRPNAGLTAHGKLDLAGTGSTLVDSVFYNGYFAAGRALAQARDNVWWGGEPVPGGVRLQPAFRGPLPATNSPGFGALTRMILLPTCMNCATTGAQLHQVSELLARIDALDGSH